ncbi:hypothetical protein PJO48_29500, partial [Mycobacterium kansasii]
KIVFNGCSTFLMVVCHAHGTRIESYNPSGQGSVGPTVMSLFYIHAVDRFCQFILGTEPKNETDPNLRWTTLKESVVIENRQLKELQKFWINLFYG